MVHSLNVRSITNRLKRRAFATWLGRLEEPSVICIQETWQHLPQQITGYARHHAFASSVWAPYSMASRGVAIVCNVQGSAMAALWTDPEGRAVVAELRLPGLPPVLVCSVYAPTVREDRPTFLREFATQVDTVLGARPDLRDQLVIAGDFNVPREEQDKFGGNVERFGCAELERLLARFRLLDCWRVANPALKDWSHCTSVTATRIDYIFASTRAVAARMESAPVDTDHKLVSACFGVAVVRDRPASLWRMNSSVLENEEVVSQVEDILAANALLNDYTVWRNWAHIKKAIARLLRYYTIRDARERQQEETDAAAALATANEAARDAPTVDHLRNVVAAEGRLRAATLHRQEEAARRMQADNLADVMRPATKSPVSFPTKLYTGDRRGQASTPDEVNDVCVEHFKRLFSKEPVDEAAGERLLDEWTVPEIRPEIRRYLSRPLTAACLLKALPPSGSSSAPGPDGLPWEFYRCFKNHVCTLLHKIMRHSLRCGSLPRGMSDSVVRLIPKDGKDPAAISSWRPIALLNCDFKLLSHWANARLQGYLVRVIHPDQAGFMPGRRIHDHIITMRALAAQEEGAILLTDDDAAYNRVSREWLLRVARRVVDDQLLSTISMLTESSSTRLLLQRLSPAIATERGVPQGLPLSPSLYNLACEPLLAALREAQLQGLRAPLGDRVRVQAYADDKALFLAYPEDLAIVKDTFARYEAASGARINPAKSTLVVLDGSPLGRWRSVWPDLSCRDISVGSPPIYLGIPLRGDPFLRARKRWKDALLSWRRQHLPLFARAFVANRFIVPLLTYAATVAPAPHDLSDLAASLKEFVWNSRIASVPEPATYKPLDAGGLGVRHLPSAFSGLHLLLLQRVHSKLRVLNDDPTELPPVWFQFCISAIAQGRHADKLPAELRERYRHPRRLPELRALFEDALDEWEAARGVGPLFEHFEDDELNARLSDLPSGHSFMMTKRREMYERSRDLRCVWTPVHWFPDPPLRRESFWTELHRRPSSFYHREARWRLLTRGMPLNFRLYRAEDPRTRCARGCDDRETPEHAFWDCHVVRGLWNAIFDRMARVFNVRLPAHERSIHLLVYPMRPFKSLVKEKREQVSFLFNVIVCHIWRTRRETPLRTARALLATCEAAIKNAIEIGARRDPVACGQWLDELRPIFSVV